MYLPQWFREDRPAVLHALVRENSFGTLVTSRDGALTATHLPFFLDPDRGPHGALLGHVARANPHWRDLATGAEALAIFQGPHAYVSPSWYETQPSVPTWNYAVVHAYGTPRVIDSGPELRRILELLVETHEAAQPEPWSISRLPEEYLTRQMRAIVGFAIEVTRWEGKWKLSQNRPAADRERVIAALRSGGELERAVAESMVASEAPSDR
jgi:transcriptional regulator